MSSDDLPLLSWSPPCKIIAFPLINRVGRIRDVAQKMIEKNTERHADYYREQVRDALDNNLQKIGISKTLRERQINAFFVEVEKEIVRFRYRNMKPGGAA